MSFQTSYQAIVRSNEPKIWRCTVRYKSPEIPESYDVFSVELVRAGTGHSHKEILMLLKTGELFKNFINLSAEGNIRVLLKIRSACLQFAYSRIKCYR